MDNTSLCDYQRTPQATPPATPCTCAVFSVFNPPIYEICPSCVRHIDDRVPGHRPKKHRLSGGRVSARIRMSDTQTFKERVKSCRVVRSWHYRFRVTSMFLRDFFGREKQKKNYRDDEDIAGLKISESPLDWGWIYYCSGM